MTDAGHKELTPGRTLGNYEVQRVLGRGGMGAVYLAYDSTLRRTIALKVVSESKTGETSHERLLHEARNAAALNHPNICTIYEVGEADGVAFIAMEHVEDLSLRDRLVRGPLPLADAIRLGLQAADALAFAHARGVVHRDFKSGNVIVTEGGRLKVVDFGLARRLDAVTSDATTMASVMPAGAIVGTPYSMAPEQVRSQPADERTDVWALGVLLHEMVSGRKPFAGASTPELYSSILRDAPAPPPPNVPVELRLVIERCLEKEPGRRYARASEVQALLEVIEKGSGKSSPIVHDRVAPRPRRLALVAILIAAAIVVGLNVSRIPGWFGRTPTTTGPVSLAVLTLDNASGNKDQDYFSDGLTEEMISVLGRWQPQMLQVVSRSASRRFTSATPASEIGRELNVGNVLRGAASRTGDRVRIVAELLDTADGRTRWTRTYEGAVSELFVLQRTIANDASAALGVVVTDSRATVAPTNTEAYDLYLRGLSRVARDNEPDLDQAIVLFERSVAIDPSFVPAHAYLSVAYSTKASTYRPSDSQWEEKGFASSQKALALDPESPEAHYARAMMLWRPAHGFPSRDALVELRRALAAKPNFDEAWHQHAVILFHVGHLDAAIRDIEQALKLNPANTTARFRYGPIFVYQLKYEEALAALERVPRDVFPAQWTYLRAWALLSLGRLEEAGRLVDQALEDNPVDQGGVLHAARAMLRTIRGDRIGAETDVAEAARVGKNFLHFHHTAYSIGAIYSRLGELDKAQEWIETAANGGFPNYAYFEVDPHLARLRETPRFRAFLAKLRQEWQHIAGEPD